MPVLCFYASHELRTLEQVRGLKNEELMEVGIQEKIVDQRKNPFSAFFLACSQNIIYYSIVNITGIESIF